MADEHVAGAAILLSADNRLTRLQRPALYAGVAGLALAALGAWLSPEQFFRSYLVAFLFFSGIAFGSLAILMLQHVTGGVWGAVIRRVLESATRTLPLLIVLFVPLLFGLRSLYAWARPDVVAHDPLLQEKQLYLNVPFFLARAVLYFGSWWLVIRYLNRWSLDQDATGDPMTARRLEQLSRGGLVLYGLTMTFASIDWVMSLEPHWFSTIYGILFIGGQVLTAFAFVIPVMLLLAEEPAMARVVGPAQFHDLGKLLLAFVMLWAYFAFSQFLIIWSGNLPEETPWYVKRLQGGWQWVALGIVVFHFALPFAVLLSRDVKRSARVLAIVAVLVVGARLIDLFWLITPALRPAAVAFHWLDVATLVGVGGVWLATFVQELQTRPLLPLHDPSLSEEMVA